MAPSVDAIICLSGRNKQSKFNIRGFYALVNTERTAFSLSQKHQMRDHPYPWTNEKKYTYQYDFL